MTKSYISLILRKLRLLNLADRLAFQVQRIKNRRKNHVFKLNNPEVNLPPDYLLYESFQLDYNKYYFDSLETAKWLVNILKAHIELKNKRILDWGCGPGRIIRHLPVLINNDCEFFGSDNNNNSIEWCIQNIAECKFESNSLEAKLPYNDNFLDIIFGISIFTHLSEQMHLEWFDELYKKLKLNGIMLFTTQGNNFKSRLTKTELRKYNQGQLIVRGNVKEGHRIFTAYQPNEFMLNLFKRVQVLEHISLNPEKGKKPPQDIWIIRKV
jgi:SAM-dependent methyltransferase